MPTIHPLTTRDGVLLHLAFFAPADEGAPVLLLTHGVANNFVTTPLWTVAEHLHAHGHGVALLNNRGHDWVTSNPIDRRWLGAAHEIFEESALDFEAALDWLAARGHGRVVLGGHSLGGLKAAFACRRLGTGQVAALVMLSSPRLPDEQEWDWPAHEALLARCRELIAQDRGSELMEVEMPTNTPALRGLMSARTYLNKYGPDASTTALRFASEFRLPVFLLAGSEEKPQLGFARDMERALTAAESVARVTVEGADHMYGDRHQRVADALSDWLARQLS